MDSVAASPTICIGVLCHNEERRIGRCLASLLPEAGDAPIHVIVNGSSDRTAQIARAFPAANVRVHVYSQGGKSRSWNRFLFETLENFADVHVFVDGDAEVASGSIAALCARLTENAHANLASAGPLNGRNAAAYRTEMRAQRGVFGDLYAVKGQFLARMKARSIRLPDDLIGDDGLIGAMAKTDLESEDNWDDSRVIVCDAAGFLCDPVRLADWHALRMQYRRMLNYSARHFQNRIVSRIMRETGPCGLPQTLASIYDDHRDQLIPRRSLPQWYFDRLALSRLAGEASSVKSAPHKPHPDEGGEKFRLDV